MSWLDSVVDFGKTVLGGVSDIFGGNSLGSSILKTVMTGYALNKVSKNVNKGNDAVKQGTSEAAPVDPGVRIQTQADTEYKIPVLYGKAVFGGSLVDARMENANKTMWYVYALCENTGNKLSDGLASQISFLDVYWNDQRIVFKADGITANYVVDRNGKINRSVSDLVKVYLYRNGSSQGVLPSGYAGAVPNAFTLVPGWDSTWAMTGLAFAVVRVDYNKEKGITGMGNVTFEVQNNMNMPGDVLYDMMTNTRYGASIDPTDIKAA